MQISKGPIPLDKLAFTDAPYRKILRKLAGSFKVSTMAAAPMIRMPVPKKKDEATEMPKYLLNITFKKV